MTTNRLEIGWRERVAFPDLGIPTIRAKVDTGARTSALHAVNIEEFVRDGERWVRFATPLSDHGRHTLCRARIAETRAIKNTSGIPEDRLIISTTVVLARRHWHIDVSLTDRDKMEFPLILGRTALRRHKLLIDPGRSYLAGDPVI